MYDKKYYQRHKVAISKSQKRYRDLNREEIKEYNREHQRELRKIYPERERLKKYNLSYADLFKMWENQSGKCKICNKKFKNPSNFHIDHNHKTGKVRGLLCSRCNSGIGFLNDDPKLMMKAADYLSEK